MFKTIFSLAAAVSLTVGLSACGGDDSGGGSSPQDQVAQLLIDEFDPEDGITVDESCIRSVTAKLSTADAAAIVAAGPDGEPEISDDAESVALELFECLDFDFGDLDDFDLEDFDLEDFESDSE